jgi:hypothetical protein
MLSATLAPLRDQQNIKQLRNNLPVHDVPARNSISIWRSSQGLKADIVLTDCMLCQFNTGSFASA